MHEKFKDGENHGQDILVQQLQWFYSRSKSHKQTKKLVNFCITLTRHFYLFSSGFGGFGGPQFGGSAANAAAGTQSFNSGGLG
jgi:hypothetical protein